LEHPRVYVWASAASCKTESKTEYSFLKRSKTTPKTHEQQAIKKGVSPRKKRNETPKWARQALLDAVKQRLREYPGADPEAVLILEKILEEVLCLSTSQ